jgi:hypothetical protein
VWHARLKILLICFFYCLLQWNQESKTFNAVPSIFHPFMYIWVLMWVRRDTRILIRTHTHTCTLYIWYLRPRTYILEFFFLEECDRHTSIWSLRLFQALLHALRWESIKNRLTAAPPRLALVFAGHWNARDVMSLFCEKYCVSWTSAGSRSTRVPGDSRIVYPCCNYYLFWRTPPTAYGAEVLFWLSPQVLLYPAAARQLTAVNSGYFGPNHVTHRAQIGSLNVEDPTVLNRFCIQGHVCPAEARFEPEARKVIFNFSGTV